MQAPNITQLLSRPDWQEAQIFLRTLQAILEGHRDPALAEDESLTFDQAAELVFLLERLLRERL